MPAKLFLQDRGGVRIMTLNRPECHNAMDIELYELLTASLREADEDNDVRVIVLRGAGPSFCSGADTKEFASLTPDKAELVAYRASLTYELHKTIPSMKKTVIAAVHGFALGGGAGLTAACDIAVAEDGAKLGYPEIRHGLVAAVVMANLTKQVGRKRAYELVSMGTILSAAEAAEVGLVTKAVASDAFGEAVRMAEVLTERNPLALQAAKTLFQAVGDVPLSEGLLLGRQANEDMRAYREEAVASYGEAVKAGKPQ